MLLAFSLFLILKTGYAAFGNPSANIRSRSFIGSTLYQSLARATMEEAGITSLSLSSDQQSYFALIQVGDINFRVALDTGSSDFWISSTACTTSACNSIPRYPLNYQSPSFVSVNNNQTIFNLSYADGTSVSGFVARESVTVSNMTVTAQAFGLATNSNVVMDDQISGVLGLGFPRLSEISGLIANATPFFATLAQQGQLDYPLFGLSLPRNVSGTFTLGAVDSSVVKNVSDISWNEVIPFPPFGSERNASIYLQWAIPLSNIWVNDTPIVPLPTYSNTASKTSIALLDIGTLGLYGPYQDVSRLFNLLDGSRLVDEGGQWAVPCDVSALIAFTFNQQNYTLQPSDYLIGPTIGDPNLCLTWPRASPPSPDGIDWQIGLSFLRTVYSVFSYGIDSKEPPMVGFYPLGNETATVESPNFVSSFFSTASATIATILPNFPLATPSYSTPPYAFNTSVPVSLGETVSTDLATSTYSPIVGINLFNASALPTISPPPTLVTFILTNSDGVLTTSTSTIATPSVTLGIPPGWSGAMTLSTPFFAPIVICFISLIQPLISFTVSI